MHFQNLQDLQKNLGKNTLKYLFFWGHSEIGTEVTKACLSQWYPSPFTVAGSLYPTAEHYMMAHKALLFDDQENFQKVFEHDDPSWAKKIGRLVQNFDDEIWNNERSRIVEEASYSKFDQNPQLRDFLAGTKNRILVEASPRDRIWGIGMSQNNSDAADPLKWRGLNLLGFALMNARTQLQNT